MPETILGLPCCSQARVTVGLPVNYFGAVFHLDFDLETDAIQARKNAE
jgi:hypothetical protein